MEKEISRYICLEYIEIKKYCGKPKIVFNVIVS